MKILILGAGRMGAWFAHVLKNDHEVAVFDTDPKKMELIYGCQRLSQLEAIESLAPGLVLSAVPLGLTTKVFDSILSYLPKDCILSDMASVKNDLKDYYQSIGFRFVSTHPMFGPTFSDLNDLSGQNAVLITESDREGLSFFRKFYSDLNLNLFEYSFEKHDQAMAYCLTTPFASTLIFSASLKPQKTPGSTFKKHLEIAKGLLSQDDALITEVLFNQFAVQQMEQVQLKLLDLIKMIKANDREGVVEFLSDLRGKV